MEAQKNEAEKHESSQAKTSDERAHIEKPEPREKNEKHEPERAKEAKAVGTARANHAAKKVKNNVRKLRMERMMSKAELARRAGVSTLTIDRVERGMSCRMDTKRKIILSLGLQLSDRDKVFAKED